MDLVIADENDQLPSTQRSTIHRLRHRAGGRRSHPPRALPAAGRSLSCVDTDTTSPTVAISSDAGAAVTGPFSITVAFSEPVTGFELEDLVVGNGSASELRGTTRATWR